jgi:hypothetical protein
MAVVADGTDRLVDARLLDSLATSARVPSPPVSSVAEEEAIMKRKRNGMNRKDGNFWKWFTAKVAESGYCRDSDCKALSMFSRMVRKESTQIQVGDLDDTFGSPPMFMLNLQKEKGKKKKEKKKKEEEEEER